MRIAAPSYVCLDRTGDVLRPHKRVSPAESYWERNNLTRLPVSAGYLISIYPEWTHGLIWFSVRKQHEGHEKRCSDRLQINFDNTGAQLHWNGSITPGNGIHDLVLNSWAVQPLTSYKPQYAGTLFCCVTLLGHEEAGSLCRCENIYARWHSCTQSHNPIRHPHWAQHYPMSPGLCILVEPGLSCVVPAEIILTAISMPDSQNAVLQVRFHLSDHCYQPSAYLAITQETVMRIYLSAVADMYEILAFFSWYCAKTLTPDIHVAHETLWYLFDMEKWHHNTIHDGILP